MKHACIARLFSSQRNIKIRAIIHKFELNWHVKWWQLSEPLPEIILHLICIRHGPCRISETQLKFKFSIYAIAPCKYWKSECSLTFQLDVFVSFHAELRDALNKLWKAKPYLNNLIAFSWFRLISLRTFEIDFAISVRVEDVDDALNQRVLLQLGQRHEFVHAQAARTVQVELLESSC